MYMQWRARRAAAVADVTEAKHPQAVMQSGQLRTSHAISRSLHGSLADCMTLVPHILYPIEPNIVVSIIFSIIPT